jgi:hypothetical protein
MRLIEKACYWIGYGITWVHYKFRPHVFKKKPAILERRNML